MSASHVRSRYPTCVWVWGLRFGLGDWVWGLGFGVWRLGFQFIDYTTSMITDEDPLRMLLFN